MKRALVFLDLIVLCSCATYKHRHSGWAKGYGYLDDYNCNGEISFDYIERIATIDAAIEKVDRRMKEFVAYYDFEGYDIIEKDSKRFGGNYIPHYGFADGSPHSDAWLRIKPKGPPRKNSYLQLDGKLVIFILFDNSQKHEKYDPATGRWIEFWGNDFLRIGDRVRTKVTLFGDRSVYRGVYLRVCYNGKYNFVTVQQDAEFEVAADGLKMIKGSVIGCAIGDNRCEWPIGYTGKIDPFERVSDSK